MTKEHDANPFQTYVSTGTFPAHCRRIQTWLTHTCILRRQACQSAAGRKKLHQLYNVMTPLHTQLACQSCKLLLR